MSTLLLEPRKALNKAILKIKPNRTYIEGFQKLPINKVNEIISLKSQDPKWDISYPEQEIDAMVYALYCLTEEEIKIVEEN
jgi:adenine-specific DNA-methyltransferase